MLCNALMSAHSLYTFDMLSALQQAQQDLQDLLQDRSHRSEAKAWLVHSLAQLQHVSRAARWTCFHPSNDNSNSSTSSPVASCRQAELHLLQLLAEVAPADVSTLLLRDPDWVCSFLTASTDRVKAWFGGFGPTSIQYFKYGARALANYALAERADAWRHLVWSGKHSQSPVAVAAKPHYFGELDVVATVRNLVRSCPRFWSSEELMRSCQAGDWLAFDRDAVAKELLRLLHDHRSSRQQPLQQLLSSFLATTDWGQLCQRLLPLLPDSALLQVARTAAQDAYSSQAQQQRKQQRQGRHRQDALLLLSCWCSKQCSFCADYAATAAAAAAAALPPAGQAPGGSRQQQEQLAALQAAAVAAAQLPCVSEPQPLLLACLQASQEGGSGWTLDQLLLANALTCCRSQLLSLLRQDEDTAGQLMSLATAAAAAAAAAAATAPGTATAATGTATSAASDHQGGAAPGAVGQLQPSQVAAAVQQLPWVQKLLLLLVRGWLLRLHLLLQLSGAAGDAVDGASGQQQCAGLPVQLPTGGSCHMYMPTATAKATAITTASTDAQAAPMKAATPPQVGTRPQLPQPPQQQQQQQDNEQAAQQQHQQQQQQPSPQHLAPKKTPLRRGPSASAGKDPPARAGSSSSERDSESDSSSSHKQRSSSRHKRRRSRKHKRHSHSKRSSHSKRHRKRSRSSSSGGSQSRARKRRRRLHSSGDTSDGDGSSSDGEWAGLDLDAGGELLDPAAFQGPPHSSSVRPKKPAGGTPLREPGPEAAAAGAESVLQQGGVQPAGPGPQGLQLPVLEERLASLAVGGRFWQRPQCLVQLPCSWFIGGGSNAEGEGGQVVLSGSITQVADAVAQLWLCAVLQSVLAGQQGLRA